MIDGSFDTKITKNLVLFTTSCTSCHDQIDSIKHDGSWWVVYNILPQGHKTKCKNTKCEDCSWLVEESSKILTNPRPTGTPWNLQFQILGRQNGFTTFHNHPVTRSQNDKVSNKGQCENGPISVAVLKPPQFLVFPFLNFTLSWGRCKKNVGTSGKTGAIDENAEETKTQRWKEFLETCCIGCWIGTLQSLHPNLHIIPSLGRKVSPMKGLRKSRQELRKLYKAAAQTWANSFNHATMNPCAHYTSMASGMPMLLRNSKERDWYPWASWRFTKQANMSLICGGWNDQEGKSTTL